MFAIFVLIALVAGLTMTAVLSLPYMPTFLVELLLKLFAKIHFYVKGLTGFLLLALVSAVWTARRAGAHYDEARDSLAPAARHQALTSKFAAERNMYLCAFAFTTFVALIRIQGILRKQVELKRELAALKSGSTATASDKGSSIKKD